MEPGDLRLGQVVIKRVAVVELGVNNGSGNGGSCFGIEVVLPLITVFTARCYASAVLAMALCLSVRHKSVFYGND